VLFESRRVHPEEKRVDQERTRSERARERERERERARMRTYREEGDVERKDVAPNK